MGSWHGSTLTARFSKQAGSRGAPERPIDVGATHICKRLCRSVTRSLLRPSGPDPKPLVPKRPKLDALPPNPFAFPCFPRCRHGSTISTLTVLRLKDWHALCCCHDGEKGPEPVRCMHESESAKCPRGSGEPQESRMVGLRSRKRCSFWDILARVPTPLWITHFPAHSDLKS
jgi:hypothetical protein